MIEICNLRNERMRFAYDVRVDRASVLGNPYYMQNESKRDEVCDKYTIYFKERLLNSNVAIKELQRIWKLHKQYGKVRLFCWCAPKRCHAEVIREFLNRYIGGLKWMN